MLRPTSLWFYIPPPLIAGALIAFWQYRKHQPDPTPEDAPPDPVEQVSRPDRLPPLPPVDPASTPPPKATGDPVPVDPPPPPPAKTLAEATGLFPGLAAQLLPKTRISGWLQQSNLLGRIVATVDNLANGASPKDQLGFLGSPVPFRVGQAADRQWYAASANALRTKAMVETFCLTDSKKIAAAYNQLEPVFDELYRDLGYPDAKFRDGLAQACRVLLDTPIPKDPPALTRYGRTFRFVDPALEKLKPAQKHLLRLGLIDARRIQTKIRQLARALQLKIPE